MVFDTKCQGPQDDPLRPSFSKVFAGRKLALPCKSLTSAASRVCTFRVAIDEIRPDARVLYICRAHGSLGGPCRRLGLCFANRPRRGPVAEGFVQTSLDSLETWF